MVTRGHAFKIIQICTGNIHLKCIVRHTVAHVVITAWKKEFSDWWTFLKRTEKIIFSLVFMYFRFREISYSFNVPSKENVRIQHLSANAYSCVNLKFSYMITVRKDEIFCRIFTKTSNFSPLLRSTFNWRHVSKKMKLATLYRSQNNPLVNISLKMFLFFR